MIRTFHWFDFEMSIASQHGKPFDVLVEATISSGNGDGVVIEGIKVRLPTGTLLVLSDRQMAQVRREIKSRL